MFVERPSPRFQTRWKYPIPYPAASFSGSPDERVSVQRNNASTSGGSRPMNWVNDRSSMNSSIRCCRSAADAARSLASLSDDEVAERYGAELVDLFPALDGAIVETKIVRWERGLPHPTVGRAKLQPALTRDLSPVFLAGDYLGSWYTETAAQTAEAAAARARAIL